jgi:hypothetical protein
VFLKLQQDAKRVVIEKAHALVLLSGLLGGQVEYR